MNFVQQFKLDFGSRFSNLHLKSVEVSRQNKTATITFLYPSTDSELSEKDKSEIRTWLKEKLNLEELYLKIKFMRVFVEEKLIKKSIMAFLDEKFKLVSTYLCLDDFSVEITPIDVKVSVNVSTRLASYFAEHNVSSELSKHLKDNFLVEFSIFVVEDEKIMDEVDIQNTQLSATYKITPRFEIEVVKEAVGHDFEKFPQFINSIKAPKNNVTVAGFLQKFQRIDYVRKSGKREGEQAVRFSFVIQDSRGKIDAVFFASKSNVAVMDAFEDSMFVVANGDVKFNYLGHLSLMVKKIALATIVNDDMILPSGMNSKEKERGVVKIEKMDSLVQQEMFGSGVRYNSKIMARPIVVFDIESTGLDTNTAEITEIGAVKIENGVFTEKLYSFVKPSESISPEITEKTGITDEMVKDAPKVDAVIRDFYDFTRGCAICGHNVIGYDMKIIVREAKKLGLDFDNEIIDTMKEAQHAHLRTTRYSLASVLKVLGLHNEGAHRAWNDAYATAQVLLKLNEI